MWQRNKQGKNIYKAKAKNGREKVSSPVVRRRGQLKRGRTAKPNSKDQKISVANGDREYFIFSFGLSDHPMIANQP